VTVCAKLALGFGVVAAIVGGAVYVGALWARPLSTHTYSWGGTVTIQVPDGWVERHEGTGDWVAVVWHNPKDPSQSMEIFASGCAECYTEVRNTHPGHFNFVVTRTSLLEVVVSMLGRVRGRPQYVLRAKLDFVYVRLGPASYGVVAGIKKGYASGGGWAYAWARVTLPKSDAALARSIIHGATFNP
jgi:hypothetical protein